MTGHPARKSARPDPISDYGRWKAEAEAIVTERDPTAVITRLSLITCVDPEDHILARIRSGLESGSPSVWFTDEVRRPASAHELARAIWAHRRPPSRRAEPASGTSPVRSACPATRSPSAPSPPSASTARRSWAHPRHPTRYRPRDLDLTGERARDADRLEPVADLPVPTIDLGAHAGDGGYGSGRRACGRGR